MSKTEEELTPLHASRKVHSYNGSLVPSNAPANTRSTLPARKTELTRIIPNTAKVEKRGHTQGHVLIEEAKIVEANASLEIDQSHCWSQKSRLAITAN